MQVVTVDVTRLVPLGTLITYELPVSQIPTLTIGTIFNDLTTITGGTLSVHSTQTYDTEIRFRAGTGIQINTFGENSNIVEIAQPVATNVIPTPTAEQVRAIRNGRVTFGNWLLSAGFAFPEVTMMATGSCKSYDYYSE